MPKMDLVFLVVSLYTPNNLRVPQIVEMNGSPCWMDGLFSSGSDSQLRRATRPDPLAPDGRGHRITLW